MSSANTVIPGDRSIWKLAVSALPVGIAVVVFLAIRWPWDLSVAVILVGIAILLSRVLRMAARGTLLLYAFVFLALLTVVGAYLTESVYQQWLPVPVLAGIGVLAALFGAAWVWRR